MVEVRCLVRAHATLGEGPLWDARRATLWWVDIKRPTLHRYHPATGRHVAVAPSTRVTALALDRAGRLVASGDGGLGLLDPESGRFTLTVPLEGEPATNRFNDGKADARGDFWAGTMDDGEGGTAAGAVYRFAAAGGVARIADGFRVPNGPAFDSAGRMYLADSALRTIYRYPADAPGETARRAPFLVLRDDQGYPDGMTCDAEDHLWVACWDGRCVRRVAPDGAIVAEVRVPAQRPTSCTFGGPGLTTLYVTSARVGLDEAALAGQPDAGGLFAFAPGVRGVAAATFGG